MIKRSITFFISFHISLAVIPSDLPDIKKQGHSETWTSAVSSAAMAKVTGGRPFAVLEYLLNIRDIRCRL
jgi:hypothetical protein